MKHDHANGLPRAGGCIALHGNSAIEGTQQTVNDVAGVRLRREGREESGNREQGDRALPDLNGSVHGRGGAT